MPTMEAPEVLSKSDEKRLLTTTIEHLPEGYLRDILTELKPEIVRAIECDFGCIAFDAKNEIDELNAEREKLRETVRALTIQRDELRAEFYKAQECIRRAETLRRDLRDLICDIKHI
jgi:hypothetical protein